MSMFEDFKPLIDAFKKRRKRIISSARLPDIDGASSFGRPPFALDDGTNYYAVIDGEGKVSPLPFGYQIVDDNIDMDEVEALFTMPLIGDASDNIQMIRYVPLISNFEMPGERSFCLESIEDSAAWNSVGEFFATFQRVMNDKAASNFKQSLSNVLVSLYDRHEELESVDHAIEVLFADSSVPNAFSIHGYQHALDQLKEDTRADENE